MSVAQVVVVGAARRDFSIQHTRRNARTATKICPSVCSINQQRHGNDTIIYTWIPGCEHFALQLLRIEVLEWNQSVSMCACFLRRWTQKITFCLIFLSFGSVFALFTSLRYAFRKKYRALAFIRLVTQSSNISGALCRLEAAPF